MVNPFANGIVHDYSPDEIAGGSAVIVFLFFVIAQALSSRWVRDRDVLKWIKELIVYSAGVDLFLVIFLWRAGNLSFQAGLACLAVSGSISLLLISIYILGCFGLVESSIRMRLMWEFYKTHPRGQSLEELLQNYNSATILKRRLDRLIVSGEVVLRDKYYSPGRQSSFFIFKERISRLILALFKHPKTKIMR